MHVHTNVHECATVVQAHTGLYDYVQDVHAHVVFTAKHITLLISDTGRLETPECASTPSWRNKVLRVTLVTFTTLDTD